MKSFLAVLLFFSVHSFAQQVPLTGFYWNNYSFYNPAMGGVAFKHEANTLYRSQWDKVNGAPNSLFVNYGTNLADRHGVGFNYLYETIGNSNIHLVKANYNYQLKLDEERKLALGTAITYQHLSWINEWNPPQSGNDPSLPTPTSRSVGLDLGAAYFGEDLVAGISITQLPLVRDNSYSLQPHVYGNLRYQLNISAQPHSIVFETQARTDFITYSQDFNVGFNWKKLLEAGIGYRTSDAIMMSLTGIIAKNYRVGYMYEHTINKLSNISRGTHEVFVGFRIPSK